MTEQPAFAAVRGIGRSGNLALPLLLSALLAGTVAAFSFFPDDQGANLVILLFGLFAIAGICVTFAFAAGLLQFSDRGPRNDVTKLICDGSADGLIVTAAGGKVLYANSAYLTLARARGLAGVCTAERLFAGCPKASEAIYRLAQAAREGRCAAEEVRLSPALSGAGEAGWYKIAVRPFQWAGVPRASFWSVADVTRDRARQEQIFQELRHAIDFLDHAPAGFFSCDEKGSVSYMNATLAAWLGYDLAEASGGGLKLSDFIVGDAAALIALGPGVSEGRTGQFDVDLRCRDGHTLPARLIHGPASRDNGSIPTSRTLVLKQPLDEDPQGESRAAEISFAQVFNATPMAIAILDKGGKISRWNAAFARLMPEALKQEADGSRSIFAGILSRDHGALEAALAAAIRATPDIPPVDVGLSGEGARSARLFFAAADGHDASSATLYALDTTEQQALQSNFAQSQKMQAIGQLAGGVAHDFNNVLTAIIGHCDLLLANHRPTDPSFRDINQIKQNANRAASLVRQLLAFSRRQTLRPQVLQLGDVLSDLQVLMRRLVGEKIDLELRHGRDLWLVKADVNQLEQVLVNLIVNARDAMPDGGKIILRTRNVTGPECRNFNEPSLIPGDYVGIEVEDSGHGIPAEVKDKIFEPFFTTKDVGKGTGLGLATVYGIVKQTGGYVFCSSTAGKGTIFSILLPRYVPDESCQAPAADQAPAPLADLTGRGTILLVEDEESVRAFGARALASRGYTVLQASTGIEALQIVEQNGGKIDLVVSDVVMPEMDGPTMLGELRKRGVKAKVIFVSGYAEDAFAKNLPGGEDFGFLPKPFSLKQLIEAVKGKQ